MGGAVMLGVAMKLVFTLVKAWLRVSFGRIFRSTGVGERVLRVSALRGLRASVELISVCQPFSKAEWSFPFS